MNHSRQWKKWTHADGDADGASDTGGCAKNPPGRVTVAAGATDGEWVKPLAATVSMTAFLGHDMGYVPVFSSGDARLRKCLNPRL
ncbi:hypothetical protein [Rudaea sp.]|uniref:hypothetical protein n=1 Tax=Rudaea sp. TaxID=2136325 RepID=UPI002ED526FA